MEKMIEATQLTKRFGALTAVDGIELAIGTGEVFGLLGPNGAGKTTTINLLTTILPLTAGSATVNGFEVRREPGKVRKSIGMVFQEPTIDTTLTGRENLILHGRLYGVPARELPGRIETMLKLVGLSARADDLARRYSGGMKRRLEIARGLLHHPAVLFLDEPTLGLDPATREHIWDYLRTLVREEQTTVVLTTHYMEEADALCDRIAIIDHGKIVACDTPAGLKASIGGETVSLRSKTPVREKVIGLPFVRKAETGHRGELVLTVVDAARHLPELISATGPLERLEVRTPTLEDVFLRHTGHELRDTPEAGEGFADTIFRLNNQ